MKTCWTNRTEINTCLAYKREQEKNDEHLFDRQVKDNKTCLTNKRE